MDVFNTPAFKEIERRLELFDLIRDAELSFRQGKCTKVQFADNIVEILVND